MKVSIDDARCVGHGMCKLAAPEIFELSDEDGHGFVLQPQVPSALTEAVRQAERGCPEGAVRINSTAPGEDMIR